MALFSQIVVAALALSSVNAATRGVSSRRLSWDKIAGYAPGSDVTQHVS